MSAATSSNSGSEDVQSPQVATRRQPNAETGVAPAVITGNVAAGPHTHRREQGLDPRGRARRPGGGTSRQRHDSFVYEWRSVTSTLQRTVIVGRVGYPSIDLAAEYCNGVALVMSSASRGSFAEPQASIEEYDSSVGDEDVPDPLLTTHFQIRYLLQCCGDFLYSMGKLLGQREPMVITPPVIARSAAEYVALLWYLTDRRDSADVRVAKMARMLRDSFLEYGVARPDATEAERSLLERVQRWSDKQNLQKVKVARPGKILNEIDSSWGKSEYDWLSSYVHGSAATVMQAHIFAAHDRRQREMNAWRHALYTASLGLTAVHRTTSLWGSDRSELDTIAPLHDHYAEWLSTGIEPTARRP